MTFGDLLIMHDVVTCWSIAMIIELEFHIWCQTLWGDRNKCVWVNSPPKVCFWSASSKSRALPDKRTDTAESNPLNVEGPKLEPLLVYNSVIIKRNGGQKKRPPSTFFLLFGHRVQSKTLFSVNEIYVVGVVTARYVVEVFHIPFSQKVTSQKVVQTCWFRVFTIEK